MKLRFIQILTAFLFVAFALNTAAAQQNRKIDFDRLNDDISIMEGIIDKLIGSALSNKWPSSARSKGFYIPEYGLIFSVPIAKSTLGPLFVFPSMPNAPKANDFSFSFDLSEFGGTKNNKHEKEVMDKISSKVQDFLGIYADAIGQMKPDDKISIYIYDKSSRSPIQLHSVSKSNISKFRSGKLSEKQFHSKILLTSLEDKNEMRSQIDILAYVLDSAVKNQSGYNNGFGYSDQGVNGIYLADFGALFLIKTSYGNFGDNFILLGSELLNISINQFNGTSVDIFESISGDKKRKRIYDQKKEMQKQAEIYSKKIKNLKNSYSKLLGDYGNTLRLVKNNEWVCVTTNWYNPTNIKHTGAPHNSLVMRVRKSDLVDYNRGKISNEDFLKKIKYTEY